MASKIKNKWQAIMNAEITGEDLYLFAFGVVLFVSFLMNTTFMSYLSVRYLNYITYLMMGILIVKIIIFDRYSWSKILMLFFLLGLAIISWRRSKLAPLMIMMTFIISAGNVDFSKITKHYLFINGTLLSFVIIYSLIGIIKNLAYYRNNTPRFSLGIDYPTDLAAYIFYFFLVWLYQHYKNIQPLHYIAIICIDMLTFLVTNARLDALMILMSIILILICKRADKGSTLSRSLIKTYWGWCIILPYIYFLLNYFYKQSNSTFRFLDNFLSGRLMLGKRGLDEYGVTYFGQHIVEHGWGGSSGASMFQKQPWSYFFIDSSYMRFLLIYGLIVGLFLVGIIVFMSLRSTMRHDYLLPTILLAITVSSLVDQHLVEITFNPFLVAFLAKNVNDHVGRNN